MKTDTNTTYTFRLPAGMDFRNICRGALTGWPQLIVAINKLGEDSEFMIEHAATYAAAHNLYTGKPEQLVSALTIDPSWISKPTSPSDVYSRSVWITARVYESAKSISTTLSEVGPFLKENLMEPQERAGFLKKVLDDLMNIAEYASKITGELNNHLRTVSNGFESSRAAYKEARNSFAEFAEFDNENKKMFHHVGTYAQSSAFVENISNHLQDTQNAAAKLSVFAVLANMADAMEALSGAWHEVYKQFNAIIQRPVEELGNVSFITDNLQIDTAITEWQGFSKITENYLKQSLIVR